MRKAALFWVGSTGIWLATVLWMDVNVGFLPTALATVSIGVTASGAFLFALKRCGKNKLQEKDKQWEASAPSSMLGWSTAFAVLLCVMTLDLVGSKVASKQETVEVQLDRCKTSSKLPNEVLLKKDVRAGRSCFRMRDGNDLKINQPWNGLKDGKLISVFVWVGDSLLFGEGAYYFRPGFTTAYAPQ